MASKRTVSVAAAIALCFCMLPPTYAVSYRALDDVEQASWAYEAITQTNNAGLLPPGYGAQFEGNRPATTAEFAYSLLCSQGVWVRSPLKGEPWQIPYLEAMAQRLGTEVPDEELTREMAAQMLAITLGLPQGEMATPFADTDSPAAIAAYAAGIIGGMPQGDGVAFCGDARLSRNQMAAIISKVRTPSGTTEANADMRIPSNTPLPSEPQSEAEFRQVMEYMVSHGLTTLDISYQGQRPEGFLNEVKETLTQVLHTLRYERSEYFTYLPKTMLKTTQQKDGTYTLTVKLAAADGDTDDMLARRQEAFACASERLQQMYDEGALRPQMTERERAQVIATWIAKNTKYVNNESRLDHTAWSVFKQGTGVCDGFSSALQAMLAMDGIQCWGQYGRMKANNEPHQWTLAILDGELLGIDATSLASTKTAFAMDFKTMEERYQFL